MKIATGTKFGYQSQTSGQMIRANTTGGDRRDDLTAGENGFFPHTAMDFTSVQMPVLDLSQQGALERGWQSVPNFQPEHLHDRRSQSTADTKANATHPSSPICSEPNPGSTHRRPRKARDFESEQSAEIEAMEVDTLTRNLRNEGQDSNSSSAASTEAQIIIPTDPGSEFEKILDVIEEAGFDSIDMMAARYYSANFKHNSIPQLAQASSRSRDLRHLLQTLQKTSKQWSKHEKQAYEEEIVRSARTICLDELSAFQERQAEGSHAPSICNTEHDSLSSSKRRGSNLSSVGAMDQLRQLLLTEEASQTTQQEKRLLRQCVPETWSLLSELARKSELPPAQVSQIVHTFLHVSTANTHRL